MSLARGGCRTQHGKGLKKPLRPKKTAPPPKREWVSTISDLSVHKLTPAELKHRHEIHKSHNTAAAQWEMQEKALKARLRQAGCSPMDKASHTIMREVFSDKLLLEDVLARSDRALAVVHDLFGDLPHRHTGHPSVTMAPNVDSPSFQRSTEVSSLSDSLLDQQAILESEDDYYYSDEEPSKGGLLQSKLKVKNKMGGHQRQRIRHGVSEQRFTSRQTPCRPPTQTALNATAAIQRVRSRQNHMEEAVEDPSLLVSQVLNPDLSPRGPGSCNSARTRKRACKTSELNSTSAASLSGEHSGLGLLQTMLAQVELDLDSLSPQTLPRSRQRPTHSFTGFSVALVSALSRMVQLLKNREHDAESATEEKRKLEEKLKEQRSLIDALTAEIMTLREETSSLKAQLQERTAELERKLDSLVSAMATHINQATVQQPVAKQPPVSVSPIDQISSPGQGDAWQPIPVQQPVAERPPVSVSPANRPSSPGQGDAWQPIPETDQGIYNQLKAQSLASGISLTSLLSPDALEAEIADLCRLRDVINAQLGRAQGTCEAPSRSSGEQKRSASVGTGTVAPDRMSRRESATMHNQHVEHVNSQNTNSIISVQQRLLEINRQNAAARGRLLELIEQQKQTLSARASPSGSPVPPSAFSPQPSGGSESVDGCLPMPSGDRRSAGSQAYSLHFEQARKDESPKQIDKQQVQDAWFALSAHVR